MTFRKFIHTSVILVTAASVGRSWGMEQSELNEHLARAAEAAISFKLEKSKEDPLVPELVRVADRTGPYVMFCLSLSTRAQLAILPFLSFKDLVALIEIENSGLLSFRKKPSMDRYVEESLQRDLARIQAIAMYTIDQIETREQWRQVATLVSQLRAHLMDIGQREVYGLATVPTLEQRNADVLLNLGRLQNNPGLILLGMASRSFTNGRAMKNVVRSIDVERTNALRSKIWHLRAMLKSRINLVGENLDITRMDHLRVGISSICERLIL